jgi:hypothetical protein
MIAPTRASPETRVPLHSGSRTASAASSFRSVGISPSSIRCRTERPPSAKVRRGALAGLSTRITSGCRDSAPSTDSAIRNEASSNTESQGDGASQLHTAITGSPPPNVSISSSSRCTEGWSAPRIARYPTSVTVRGSPAKAAAVRSTTSDIVSPGFRRAMRVRAFNRFPVASSSASRPSDSASAPQSPRRRRW